VVPVAANCVIGKLSSAAPDADVAGEVVACWSGREGVGVLVFASA
jgi:hypothetical protein